MRPGRADRRARAGGRPRQRAALAGLHSRREEARGPELAVGAAGSAASAERAINSYSTKPHAFDDDDLAPAEAFVGCAGVAIGNAHLYGAIVAQARQLEEAMASRAVI